MRCGKNGANGLLRPFMRPYLGAHGGFAAKPRKMQNPVTVFPCECIPALHSHLSLVCGSAGRSRMERPFRAPHSRCVPSLSVTRVVLVVRSSSGGNIAAHHVVALAGASAGLNLLPVHPDLVNAWCGPFAFA